MGSDQNDDLARCVAVVDVAERFDDLAQREPPIYRRLDYAGG